MLRQIMVLLKRNSWPICIVSIFSILIFLILTKSNELAPGGGVTWKFGSSNSGTNRSEDVLSDLPIIVWWTENLFPHLERWDTISCGDHRCHTTRDRGYSKHPQTTAFYFYGTDFKAKDLPLPRLQRHIWALAHEESPLNTFALDHAVAMDLINYTATYHRAADFPITTLSFPGTAYILNRDPVHTTTKTRLQKSKGLAPVMYVQSHCEVPSDRDRYVTELMKYIKVDSYGRIKRKGRSQHRAA